MSRNGRRSHAAAPLLDVLLDYARQELTADWAVFLEWCPEGDEYAVAAAAARPRDRHRPEAREPLPCAVAMPDEGGNGSRPRSAVFDRDDPTTPEPVAGHLQRIGAVRGLVLAIPDGGGGRLCLQLFYADRTAGIGKDELRIAARLGPMLVAARSRDLLADEHERLIADMRSSEDRFRRLVEQLPAAVYERDAEGRTVYLNPPPESIIGYRGEDWRDDPEGLWLRVMHSDDRDRVLHEWRRAVKTGVPANPRYRVVADDGTIVWIQEYERVFRDAAGAVASRQGIRLDVTAETLADRARVDAELRYRTLIEQLPAATYIEHLDRTGLYVSPQIESITGMSPEEWCSGLGGWLDHVHPDDREHAAAMVRRRPGAPEPLTLDYRMMLPNGEVRWLQERSTTVASETGEPLVHGVVIDVTATRQAEIAREHSERRLRALVEQIPAAAYVDDTAGRAVFRAPQIEQLTGYPRSRWQQDRQFWMSYAHPEDVAEVAAEYRDAIQSGSPFDREYRIIRADGEVRWIHDNATVLRDEHDHPYLVQGILTDITDRKLHEQLLRKSEDRRRAVLGAMVAAEEGVRHRIAGELHDDSIQVMTATLLSLDRMLRAARSADLERVIDAGTAARETLASATERTRRLSFELRPPMLGVHGLARALRALAAEIERDAGIEIHVRSRLRRYDETTETMVYRGIREALANVRKHSHAHLVRMSAVERRGSIECEVNDDGVGFDTRRAFASGRVRLHFGLDAIAERVRLAGGEFDVDSAPGRGTRVSIRVPIAVADHQG